MGEIQQPLNLRPPPSQSASQLAVVDTGIAHRPISSTFAVTSPKSTAQRRPAANAGSGTSCRSAVRRQHRLERVDRTPQRVLLIGAEGHGFQGTSGKVTSSVPLSSGSRTTG